MNEIYHRRHHVYLRGEFINNIYDEMHFVGKLK